MIEIALTFRIFSDIFLQLFPPFLAFFILLQATEIILPLISITATTTATDTPTATTVTTTTDTNPTTTITFLLHFFLDLKLL